MNWVANSTAAPYGKTPLYNGYMWGIYEMNGSAVFFAKTDKASWFIVSKLGNCGEDAWYFAGVMKRLGFRSRVVGVPGEDHMWAEFYDENGKKVVVDPSSNMFINDTFKFAENKPWSYVEAVDFEGTTEDLTEDYLKNVSVLDITVIGNSVLSWRTQASVYSLALVSNSGLYASPQEVKTIDFSGYRNFSLSLGSKAGYQLTKRLDFYIVQFEETGGLNLTTDQGIDIYSESLLDARKFKVSPLGWFSLLFIFMATALYLVLRAIRARKRQSKGP